MYEAKDNIQRAHILPIPPLTLPISRESIFNVGFHTSEIHASKATEHKQQQLQQQP